MNDSVNKIIRFFKWDLIWHTVLAKIDLENFINNPVWKAQ